MKKISSGSISEVLSEQEREQSRQIGEARVAAVSWMKLTRKSSGQVQAFLRQKGFPDDIVQLALSSLIEDGTIDDRLLASKLVRQRQGRSAESSVALRQRMRRLGLADEAIETAIPDASLDEAAAVELLVSRFGQSPADCRKVGRFLSSRGFNTEVVVRVLREHCPGFDRLE